MRIQPPEVMAEVDRIIAALTLLRYQQGISQRDLARKLKWRQAQISDMERRKIVPLFSNLVAYAMALGASVDVILPPLGPVIQEDEPGSLDDVTRSL